MIETPGRAESCCGRGTGFRPVAVARFLPARWRRRASLSRRSGAPLPRDSPSPRTRERVEPRAEGPFGSRFEPLRADALDPGIDVDSTLGRTRAVLEARLHRLEEILARMESDDVALEEALKLFEEGVAHVREAEKVLAETELRVEELLAGGETRPLDSEEP